MTLFDFLMMAMAGGLAGGVISLLAEYAGWFQAWNSEVKWWFVLCLTVFLPPIAFLAASGMGYLEAPPTDWRGWIEELFKYFAVGFATWFSSQGTHIILNKRLNGK